jgi:hypothetical protein
MITLTLNEQELQMLSGLLDAAQRQLGLQGNKPIGHMLTKLEEAVAAANVAPKTNGHDAEQHVS